MSAKHADKKILTHAVDDLTRISVKNRYRLSPVNRLLVKIREGMPIGCKVTLRRERMYEFLQRLIMVAIPRICDFRGFSVKSFDGRGNYSFGIKEQIVFPEIEYDKIEPFEVWTLRLPPPKRRRRFALLKAFGFPFKE